MTNSLTRFAGGGLVYTPPMMQFDGSTGYYSDTVTCTGNKKTVIGRFKLDSFVGNTITYITQALINAHQHASVIIYSSDWSAEPTAAGSIGFIVRNTANATVCFLLSDNIIDGEEHTFLFSYDGDAGTAVFIIDGVNAIDPAVAYHTAPITGTLDAGSLTVSVGAATTGLTPFAGQIGFLGRSDAYLTNWQDFMHSDGRPKQLDKLGWTQWNGGTWAMPSMTFDGSTGYYLKTGITTTGNKVTLITRFKRASFTGASYNLLALLVGNSSRLRFQALAFANDYATASDADHVRILVQNSAGATVCALLADGLLDNQEHTLFFEYDGDAGTAQFIIDGVNADDVGHPSRVAPTTATLDTGASSKLIIASASDAGSFYFGGQNSYFGVADIDGLNWSDFMESDGTPKDINEISWQEWGGQPLFWNRWGKMDENKGSAGNMTKNGTITFNEEGLPLFWNPAGDMENNHGREGAMTKNGTIVVSEAGSTGHPLLGLNTDGNATTDDILPTKTAWVDGVEIIGAHVPSQLTASGGVRGTLFQYRMPTGLSGSHTARISDAEIIDSNITERIGSDAGTIDTSGWYTFSAANSSLWGEDLPARTAAYREYQMLVRSKAGITTNDSVQIAFNVNDAYTDYWLAFIQANTPTTGIMYIYRIDGGGGTFISNALFSTAVNLPIQARMTLRDYGDRIVFLCDQHETDSLGDQDQKLINYTVGSRPYQTNTGFRFISGVNNSWEVREMCIRDVD